MAVLLDLGAGHAEPRSWPPWCYRCCRPSRCAGISLQTGAFVCGRSDGAVGMTGHGPIFFHAAGRASEGGGDEVMKRALFPL